MPANGGLTRGINARPPSATPSPSPLLVLVFQRGGSIFRTPFKLLGGAQSSRRAVNLLSASTTSSPRTPLSRYTPRSDAPFDPRFSILDHVRVTLNACSPRLFLFIARPDSLLFPAKSRARGWGGMINNKEKARRRGNINCPANQRERERKCCD